MVAAAFSSRGSGEGVQENLAILKRGGTASNGPGKGLLLHFSAEWSCKGVQIHLKVLKRGLLWVCGYFNNGVCYSSSLL